MTYQLCAASELAGSQAKEVVRKFVRGNATAKHTGKRATLILNEVLFFQL